jgi:DNA helicase-2/ATP-dependent DNA helicase PcrA
LSFYQRKEVKDVIAYMRLITNPNDEEALKRVINYPSRGIGDTTLAKIIGAASLHGLSLWEVLSKPLDYNLNINAGTAKKLEAFQLLINWFIEAGASQNAYELGGEIVRKTGIINELYSDRTPEGLSRVQNVEELISSLYEFVATRQEEGRPDIRLGDFLAEISLLTDQDTDKDEQVSRVTMMTVHSAKGLEFNNVFIVGLEENLFPSELSRNSSKEIEEERRLFYVAITRAEKNVILTYAKSRFRNGQPQMCTPSRFIRDIDGSYLRLPGSPAFGSKNENLSSCFPPETIREPLPAHPQKLRPIKEEQPPAGNMQNVGDLSIGCTIRHERFGLGKIIELTGENENAKASVVFENFGKKQLLLKFAKFELIK